MAATIRTPTEPYAVILFTLCFATFAKSGRTHIASATMRSNNKPVIRDLQIGVRARVFPTEHAKRAKIFEVCLLKGPFLERSENFSGPKSHS